MIDAGPQKECILPYPVSPEDIFTRNNEIVEESEEASPDKEYEKIPCCISM